MATVPQTGVPISSRGALDGRRPGPRHAARAKPRSGKSRLRRGENLFGWLFVSPSVAILVLFMVVPIFLALYVSFTNWSGLTSPFSHSVQLVGLTNYRTLVTPTGALPDRLRHLDPRQLLFLPVHRASPDGARPVVGEPCQQQVPARQGVFPDRLLFPVRHELDCYNHRFYISLPGRRRRQHHSRVVRRKALGLRPERCVHKYPQALSAYQAPAGATICSLGFRCGTGSPGLPSECVC